MASDVRNAEEMSAIVNDLIKDIEELKAALKIQQERINRAEEGQLELYKKMEGWEASIISRTEKQLDKDINTSSLEAVLKQGLLEINEEVKKQHTHIYQTKQYSVFGDRCGAEHFRGIVDTVMKWIIILIGTFALISIIKFLIHFQ